MGKPGQGRRRSHTLKISPQGKATLVYSKLIREQVRLINWPIKQTKQTPKKHGGDRGSALNALT